MPLKYAPQDIVSVKPEFGNRTFLILEVRERDYYAMEMKSKKRYPLLEDQIAVKTGQVESGTPAMTDYLDEHDPVASEVFCNEQAKGAKIDEVARWLTLAKLKPGDKLKLVHRKLVFPAIFIKVNTDKPVFPLRAKIKGLTHDFRLDSMIDLQTVAGEV